jgi:tetratricopeptide (TPR) repeat protein
MKIRLWVVLLDLSLVVEHLKNGKFQEALLLIEKIESRQVLSTTEQLECLYQKAVIFNRQGDFNAGLKVGQDLVEKNLAPETQYLTIDAMIVVAEAYWRLDRESKALQMLEQGHQLLQSQENNLPTEDFMARHANLLYYEAVVLLNISQTCYRPGRDINTTQLSLVLTKAEESLSFFEKINQGDGVAQVQQYRKV